MKGNKGLAIELLNGKNFLIGTQKPEELTTILEKNRPKEFQVISSEQYDNNQNKTRDLDQKVTRPNCNRCYVSFQSFAVFFLCF